MLDPAMMDPSVFQAAQKAGLDQVNDLNHNGKIDVQDVALEQAAKANTCNPAPIAVIPAQ